MSSQDDQYRHRGSDGGTAGFVLALLFCLLIGGTYFGYVTFQRNKQELQMQMEKERDATEAKLKALGEAAQMESEKNSEQSSAGGDESEEPENPEEIPEVDAADLAP